ncbi:MAG: prephenate dehydrogenase [Bacteroidota bacterium]
MTISIIGIGHIGGSLAIGLQEGGFADRIIGVDASPAHLEIALRRRLIDETLPLAQAVKTAQLIVVATPVDASLQVLPQVLDLVETQVVTELGSTKKNISDAVRHHPNRGRLVLSHPMAGTEFSGPDAAVPGLFRGRCAVLCEAENSDPDAVDLVEKMYACLAMRLTRLNAEEHDIHAAYVSHISHISSFALALTVLEKEKDEQRIFELASGGFESTVRLAKSSPDMWTPIFRQNRDNVLDVLDEHIHVLSVFRSCLIKRNFEQIHRLIEQANEVRRILNQA